MEQKNLGIVVRFCSDNLIGQGFHGVRDLAAVPEIVRGDIGLKKGEVLAEHKGGHNAVSSACLFKIYFIPNVTPV